jgi:hypothetical protein
MSIRGSPYARFARALDAGNLTLIRASAAELPRISLEDALRICLVIREHEPQAFDRAARRWLARYAVVPGTTLDQLGLAVAAFQLMRRQPDLAMELLEQIAP